LPEPFGNSVDWMSPATTPASPEKWPRRLLATAVANCLSASLLFAMRKFRNEPGPLRTHAAAWLARNDQGACA
jgi:hypothetical protein